MARWSAMVAAQLALVVWVTPASAQGTTFGVKLGVASATAKFGGDSEAASEFLKRRTGKAIGAFLTLGKGVIGVQFEALYTDKGVGFEADFQGSEFAGEIQLAYVEVPALLRLAIPAGKVRPYLYAGGAAAFEVSCAAEITVDGASSASTCEDAEDQTGTGTSRRKLDLTALGGGGVQVSLNRLAVLFELRYARGLRSLDPQEGGTDVRNEVLSFLVGVALPLGFRP